MYGRYVTYCFHCIIRNHAYVVIPFYCPITSLRKMRAVSCTSVCPSTELFLVSLIVAFLAIHFRRHSSTLVTHVKNRSIHGFARGFCMVLSFCALSRFLFRCFDRDRSMLSASASFSLEPHVRLRVICRICFFSHTWYVLVLVAQQQNTPNHLPVDKREQ